jgi:molecular chaperone Hsp33
MIASKDTIHRTMTDDGAFRVITVQATDTVSGVLDAQRASGDTARHLGDLVTGAVLIRETMSPSLRVQAILKRRQGNGYLLGDSHPSGSTRALVAGGDSGFEMNDALLRVVRTLQDGRIQQGVVAVPDGADVSKGLMAYMQESEQITTMIVVGTLFEEERVIAAGGYLVQLLPGANRAPLMIMSERLEEFRNIDKLLLAPDFSPQTLTKELLWAMPYTELESSSFRYKCWCSRTSMMGALSSLNRGEIQAMVDDGEVLEIACDYCRKDYRVTPAELTGLLDEN